NDKYPLYFALPSNSKPNIDIIKSLADFYRGDDPKHYGGNNYPTIIDRGFVYGSKKALDVLICAGLKVSGITLDFAKINPNFLNSPIKLYMLIAAYIAEKISDHGEQQEGYPEIYKG